LRLILVSGETAEFLFTDIDTVTAITEHVFDNWPSGMYHQLCDMAQMEVINFLHWELNPDMVIACWSTLGPVSTGMGDRVWVQFPVQDIFSLSE